MIKLFNIIAVFLMPCITCADEKIEIPEGSPWAETQLYKEIEAFGIEHGTRNVVLINNSESREINEDGRLIGLEALGRAANPRDVMIIAPARVAAPVVELYTAIEKLPNCAHTVRILYTESGDRSESTLLGYTIENPRRHYTKLVKYDGKTPWLKWVTNSFKKDDVASAVNQHSDIVESKSQYEKKSKIEAEDSALTIYQTYLQLKRLTKKVHHVSPRTLSSCRVLMPIFGINDKKNKLDDDSPIGDLIKLADKIISEKGKAIVDPHLNTGIHIYVNRLAEDTITEKSKSFPVGGIIVKEKLKLDGFDQAVHGIGGMIKRTPGYDSANGDWEYFYADKTTKFSSGRLKSCIECHTDARATDYVFSVWKIAVENNDDNEQYPAKGGVRNPWSVQSLSEGYDTLEMGNSFRRTPAKVEQVFEQQMPDSPESKLE